MLPIGQPHLFFISDLIFEQIDCVLIWYSFFYSRFSLFFKIVGWLVFFILSLFSGSCTYQCQPKCQVNFLESYNPSEKRLYYVKTIKVTFGSTTWSDDICYHRRNTWSTILEISCPSLAQGIICFSVNFSRCAFAYAFVYVILYRYTSSMKCSTYYWKFGMDTFDQIEGSVSYRRSPVFLFLGVFLFCKKIKGVVCNAFGLVLGKNATLGMKSKKYPRVGKLFGRNEVKTKIKLINSKIVISYVFHISDNLYNLFFKIRCKLKKYFIREKSN